MTKTPRMTRDQFTATKHPCNDELWNVIEGFEQKHKEYITRDTCHVYGVGEDEYLIHEHDGKFWVHAWWYSPISYATLAEAEAKLYPWYCEFN